MFRKLKVDDVYYDDATGYECAYDYDARGWYYIDADNVPCAATYRTLGAAKRAASNAAQRRALMTPEARMFLAWYLDTADWLADWKAEQRERREQRYPYAGY